MGVTVTIIETGIANLASVAAGLARLDAAPRLTADRAEMADAAALVLPGVGAFGAGMAWLREHGLDDLLAERIKAERPTLAICLGLQLLCRSSEETPGVAGIGVLPVDVTRFPSTVRVPQLGWNRVEVDENDGLLESGYAYFANSYRVTECPPGWRCAWTDHGGPFVAALARGNVLACQFHPELSGVYGAGLLKRWLAVCAPSARGGSSC